MSIANQNPTNTASNGSSSGAANGFAPTHDHPGRPRVLDESKQREICALLSAGCGLREAARYVGCNPKTIRREAQRNEQFDTKLRRAEMVAELTPLRAIQQAATTHWRAAAWLLERTHPERFGRRDPKGLGGQDARDLITGIVNILGTEIRDPLLELRVRERVKAALEAALHHTWETRSTSTRVRRALEQLESQQRASGYLDQFGFPTPKLDALLDPPTNEPKPTTTPATTPNCPTPPPSSTAPPRGTGGSPGLAGRVARPQLPATGVVSSQPAGPRPSLGAQRRANQTSTAANNVPERTLSGTKFRNLCETLAQQIETAQHVSSGREDASPIILGPKNRVTKSDPKSPLIKSA